MLDWITLSVEAVGIIIFVIWLIIPIREFRLIYKRLKQERSTAHSEPSTEEQIRA
jgi:hypothetical protein